MNPALPSNAAAPQDRYAAALQINRNYLERDLSATTQAYQETIQVQQDTQVALHNEIALLRAQLEDARHDQERMRAELEAARIASAAMMRQNASQQAELSQLRPIAGIFRRMETTVAMLEKIKPEDWQIWIPDYANEDIPAIQHRAAEKAKNFSRTGTYIPTHEHWEPILADIRNARPLLAFLNPGRLSST